MKSLINFSRILGSYMPSFFYMKLGFPFYDNPETLFRLSNKELSTFIHEYIHFLQDISSFSLLNNAYVYSEYIHSVTNYIYKLPHGVFSVPLKMPYNLDNVDLNKFINSTCMGDFRTRDSIFIKRVEFKRIKVPYKNKIVNELSIPFLYLTDGTELKFGTCAIMESMAYLIERLITKGSVTPPDYPYQTAEYVACWEYEEFAKDKLCLIALCDLALQFNNPGEKFVQTLRDMKSEGYIPQTPEDLYKRIYQQSCSMLGKITTLPMCLIDMGNMVQDRLKKYLNDSHFDFFHKTIRSFIGFGIENRLRHPYFMIDLVRDGYALYNKTFLMIRERIDSPLIVDSENNFTCLPSVGESDGGSFPYFLAVNELYKCFSEGSTVCEMYDFCNSTVEHANEIFGENWQHMIPIVDDNCWQRPWLKINDARLCPYAFLWKHWKLQDWIPSDN
ncbi:hypothetical protein I6E75_13545 [Prevotella copri]|uniref:hypothetical protein n=1 Tax=Segatella copri TaxID=165179 RepID=UPI001F3A7943|nr:hypothetical protein [Segatella copri]MCF2611244.1 hypothetical protein [Segatella copri]